MHLKKPIVVKYFFYINLWPTNAIFQNFLMDFHYHGIQL